MVTDEVVLIGTFRLPFENRAKAKAAMVDMVVASRAEADCLEYSYAFDLEDNNLVRVCERWQNHQAFDQHRSSTHLKVWRDNWPALEISDPKLFIYSSKRTAL